MFCVIAETLTRRKAEKRKNQGKSAGNILSPIKQKRKKEHTGGKPQQTEKAEAVEKPETKVSVSAVLH